VGAVVLDSSIVLGLLDPDDAHHQSATAAVRAARSAGHALVLPASAFAEVLVGASRVGPAAVEKTEAFVDSLIDQLYPIDRAVAKDAARLRSQSKAVRLPDALVVAVGRVINATAIVTADARWEGLDRRVKVVADPDADRGVV
jgi:predicted nucleic acid-binding protein